MLLKLYFVSEPHCGFYVQQCVKSFTFLKVKLELEGILSSSLAAKSSANFFYKMNGLNDMLSSIILEYFINLSLKE